MTIFEQQKLTQHLLSGLAQLAAHDPDHARELNGVGFNSSDTYLGCELAKKDDLTEDEVQQATELCKRYRRQLGEEFQQKLEELLPIEDCLTEFTQPAAPTTDTTGELKQPTDSQVITAPPVGFTIQGQVPENEVRVLGDKSGARPEPVKLAQPVPVADRLTSAAVNTSSMATAGPGPVELTLTEEQNEALARILKWMDDQLAPQQFNLGGYAGTGKTTLIKAIKAALRSKRKHVTICAFTGKAVNVLQRKGLTEAQTMHSLMYEVEVDDETKEISFHKKWRLTDKTDLIIVDEASMLNTELYRDVLSYKVKVLFVGDPGQLEPVGDNPNVMARCDFTLSKIHRQAEKSPILTFAHAVRGGSDPRRHITVPGSDLQVVQKAGFRIPDMTGFDQIICAKNKTRIDINKRFRIFQNRNVGELYPGDKIIVLRNNTQVGVFNGMILFIDQVLEPESNTFFKVHCRDEINRKFWNLRIWREPLSWDEEPKGFIIPKWAKAPLVYATHGYAITCHKSQGSEWDSVMVWHEYMPPHIWDMKRWSYTAITRAAKKLTYCV